jgi:hypothetical protein
MLKHCDDQEIDGGIDDFGRAAGARSMAASAKASIKS